MSDHLGNICPFNVGLDLFLYIEFDVLLILVLHADLVATLQSNERIVSAREAYRDRSSKATEELNKLSRYVFATLVKRIDVHIYLVLFCRIDHSGLEKCSQLTLVPMPLFFEPPLGLAFILV